MTNYWCTKKSEELKIATQFKGRKKYITKIKEKFIDLNNNKRNNNKKRGENKRIEISSKSIYKKIY